MSDLVQSPAVRKTYTTTNLDNPIFVDDILAANQFTQSMAAILAALGSSDFAIISGLNYVTGTPNTYTAGYFFFNGSFYYQSAGFNENSYLHPNPTDSIAEGFPDSVTRYIYTTNYSTANTTSTGGTPEFTGNMNQYRIGLKTINSNLQPLLFGNEYESDLSTGYSVAFTKDKCVLFAAASANATITFNMTNAIPGCVVTLQFTFGGGRTIGVTAPSGGTLYLESGDLGLAAGNTNFMNFLYVGLDGSGNPIVRYTFNQGS